MKRNNNQFSALLKTLKKLDISLPNRADNIVWPMTTTEVILTLECSLLAVFIFLMVGALVFYKWTTIIPQRQSTTTSSKSRDRNYIILPHTSAEPVQLERNVKQVNDNNDNTEHALIDDRTDAGRLYFSLKYDDKSSILTIKLIKGENLPLVSKCDKRAFVSVQIISHKTDQKKRKEEKRISTTYQRTYRFPLSTNDLASHTIRFEVSRFDRYSKKYDLGHVAISLAELQSHGVDIRREAFFTRSICPWRDSEPHTRKRRLSSTDEPETSQVLRRVKKDSKQVKQRRPQVLWHKLSHAVHAGLYQGLIRGRHESLQWDPFLIIQKYEHADSDEYSSPDKQGLQRKLRYETDEEETPKAFPEVFSSIKETPATSNASPQPSDSSPDNEALKTPVNREFYRLVHSPLLSQSDSAEPVTSWSIPETFRFPPSPVRLQSSTVLFQSAPAACQRRHDRRHKLTSLSSSYRKRILRKSQKRATVYRRNKLTRMEPLHRLLYLAKDKRTERSSDKRLRGNSDSEN